MEHYRPLTGGAAPEAAFAAMLGWLVTEAAPGHDLKVPGVDDSLRLAAAALAPPRRLEIEERPAFMIDLAATATDIDGHAFWGGASGRRAVRTSLQALPVVPDLQFELACDVAQAEAFLRELIELHQARWTGRGREGAFGHPWMRQFSTALARRPEISRLLRLRTGGRTRAVLFNLRHGNYEASFQSGVAPGEGRGDRPAYLAHLMAAQMALRDGLSTYDFMAGDNQLKRSFSNRSYRLTWIDLRIDGTAARLERALRKVRKVFRTPSA